jgi:hypothetical protein
LFLPFAVVPEPAIDSPWTLELKHHDAKIRAEIPLLTGRASAKSAQSRTHRRRFNCHAAGAVHRIEFEREGFRRAALVWLGAHLYHAIAEAAIRLQLHALAYISAISCGRWRCRKPWNRGR